MPRLGQPINPVAMHRDAPFLKASDQQAHFRAPTRRRRTHALASTALFPRTVGGLPSRGRTRVEPATFSCRALGSEDDPDVPVQCKYRQIKPYWTKRFAKVSVPFELRLLNGMNPPVPEVTVLIHRITKDRRAGEYRLHIKKVLGFKHWDKRRQRPKR